MTALRLSAWIGSRTPPVPAGFAEWMRPSNPDRPALPADLADEAAAALDRTLTGSGRPRGGAFDLLAADGFLTWAAEAALDEADPDAALQRLVERFGR